MADKVKLTKRAVDAAQPAEKRFEIWDSELTGFGLRVEPSGVRSFVVRYRPGAGGRTAPKRFISIGRYGEGLTPDQARDKAKATLRAVARGEDPAAEKSQSRTGLSVGDLVKVFMAEHVETKRKPTTAALYRHALDAYAVPEFGARKAAEVLRADVARLHHKMKAKPFLANRVLAIIGAMFGWAGKHGLVAEGFNPTLKIEKYKEDKRERFLSSAELEMLGASLRQAETIGLPWQPTKMKSESKHVPAEGNRIVKFDPTSTAAIRMLLLTGARLREILHLRWSYVDFERGLLLLPDSKTGQKTIILNAPSLAVLEGVPRTSSIYVFPAKARPDAAGKKVDKPRSDLKRPWSAVARHAGLKSVRLHDLRHTHASFGAGAGLGLPIIGKLLGHTQSSTTQRYAHLDNDPLRRASEQIGGTISAALGPKPPASVTVITKARRRGG